MDHPALSRRRLLALLAAGAFASRTAQASGASPALLLAQHAPSGLHPAGYLVSEKYDGVRALWDGRRLLTRGGHEVAAPAAFLRRLPPLALDGELWAGRGRFEEVAAAVRRKRPDDAEWQRITYMVFELPGAPGSFRERAARLATLGQDLDWPGLQAVEQYELPDRAALARQLATVLAAGGEGLMLHRADAPYLSGRSPVLLKLKPVHDAEAVVLAVVPGQGRHAGRMGALRVRTPQGREFLLGTGFSDAERSAPPPPGSVLTYTFRGTTEQGLPRFASFLRLRSP